MNEVEQALVNKMRRPGGAAMNRIDMCAIAACPICGRSSGQPCAEKKGGNANREKVHFKRMQAAQRRLAELLAEDKKVNPKKKRTRPAEQVEREDNFELIEAYDERD